jgi:hypothetical protein
MRGREEGKERRGGRREEEVLYSSFCSLILDLS